MKKRYSIFGALAALCAVTLFAADVKLEGIKCVANAKAETGVDYKDAKVFFCCGNCAKKFSEAPEKGAVRANHQLAATKQYEQAKCPLTGRDLNDEHTVKVNGVNVTFCCPGCKGKVSKAEEAEQLELVFSDKAFEKGFKNTKEEDDK
jgi:YHS domain-containing protein